jgi:tetratricopeptide (TPR) repeat protein
MYQNEMSKLPGSLSSVAVDKEGFIYTTTSGNISVNQVKKLNIRGLNMIQYNTDQVSKVSRTFGEIRPYDRKFVAGQGFAKPQLIDAAIDYNGNITVIDGMYKVISQYDANGNLLYFWGGPSSDSTTQLGLMKNPVAIDANSRNDLFILDSQEGIIQVFRLSEFGLLVNKANGLTMQGRYEESEKPWKEVLRNNRYFTPALLGLGKAEYKKGNYEQASQYFYEGGSRSGYSDAFWQIRLNWFQSHFSTLATTVISVIAAFMLFNRITRKAAWRTAWHNRKRSTLPIVVQLKQMFTILRHPIDGFSALRYENKGSYWSALAILLMVFGSISIIALYTGFTFNNVDTQRLNLVLLFGQFLIVWLGWVVANYFVSSIYRGEGRFRDVFIASSYALVPLIFVGIPLAVLSNIMTLSEQAIYNYMFDGMVIWVVLMIFWKIQSLQNYSVGETGINVVLSASAFIMMAVLIMITFGLSSDMSSFIYEVYQEVRVR